MAPAWGLLLLFSAPTASAAARIALKWNAPASCATATEVIALVEQVASGRLERGNDPDFRVHIDVRHEETEWVAEVRLERPRGELIGVRELRRSAVTCHGLDDAVALVTALLLDLEPEQIESAWAAPERTRQESVAEVGRPVEGVARSAPAPVPRVIRLPSEPLTTHGTIAGGAIYGYAPGFAAVGGVGLEVGRTHWSVGFALDVVAPQTTHVQMVGLTTLGVDATAFLCERSRWSSVAIGGCGGPMGGLISGSGEGLPSVATRVAWVAGADVWGVLDLPLAAWAGAEIQIGARVPFGRHRFYVRVGDAEVELHRTLLLAPFLRLAVRFGS